jgi:aerobic-type carbon monoxide dehydrogenase small subunit (CoxS/CutS family)
MEEDEKKIELSPPKRQGEVSRREFLKDAGLVVGGATIGSMAILSACGKTETVTKTSTVTATTTATATVTTPGSTTPGTTVSVSKYICPTCSEEFNSLALLKTHFESVHKEIPTSAALNLVKYTVNGQEYDLQVEPQETLHDVLREKLGFLSLKDMCTGWGACGSCSVIVGGRPILSCMGLAIEFDGSVMETAEGLHNIKHPLIDAYVKNYAMQCGYCTPGFIVTAKALLDHNPNPTVEEIREALGGNLCRCATYPRHVPAVQAAAAILRGGS